MRRALEYIGRRPIVSTWIGLQFNLFLYWRISEAYFLHDRLYVGLGILGAMSLLNTPGIWVVALLAEVVEGLTTAGDPWRPSDTEDHLAFLAIWILSALATYFFWTVPARPSLRWLVRTLGNAGTAQCR